MLQQRPFITTFLEALIRIFQGKLELAMLRWKEQGTDPDRMIWKDTGT